LGFGRHPYLKSLAGINNELSQLPAIGVSIA
jgi:hypothetical protein